MSLRVRFAPSPTGYLHVGGARTALFNWLLARREGGRFLLRIEDTDRNRSSQEMVDAIIDGMTWLGLDWDEGPFFQGEGVERHRADALRLLAEGKAYRDFTPPDALARIREEDPDAATRYPRRQAESLAPGEAEERAAAGEPHAIRFLVPDHRVVEFEDRVHGHTRFPAEAIEDLVILRADGSPTYNLAVVSDDAFMNITLVMRGDDHLSNTPKQILLYEALGYQVPEFAHLPLILGPDGKRLSKRHGATAVGDYEGRGILAEAMVNFLALLGWSPGTDQEVMSRRELVAAFSLDRVVKKSAVFDSDKLGWLNGQHLNRMDGVAVASLVLDHLESGLREAAEAAMDTDPAGFGAVLDLLTTRARSVEDVALKLRPYLVEEIAYDPEAVSKHWAKRSTEVAAHLEALRDRLMGLGEEEWTEARLEEELRALAGERGVGAGKLIHPLRVALVGEAVSPGIFEVLVAMGPDRSLSRMAAGVQWIRTQVAEDA